MVCRFNFLLFAMLVIAPSAFAQSGWERGGAAIGEMLRPATPTVTIIPVSIDGGAGSKIYAECLLENTRKYGASASAPNDAVRAAFSVCVQQRQIFYSSVYADIRKNEREKAAIQITNNILEKFELDSINALPRFALESAASAQSAKQPAQDKYDQLAKLKKLLDSGALSQPEYEREKELILSGN